MGLKDDFKIKKTVETIPPVEEGEYSIVEAAKPKLQLKKPVASFKVKTVEPVKPVKTSGNTWIQALKMYAAETNSKYTVYSKGTPEYNRVKEIQNSLK